MEPYWTLERILVVGSTVAITFMVVIWAKEVLRALREIARELMQHNRYMSKQEYYYETSAIENRKIAAYNKEAQERALDMQKRHVEDQMALSAAVKENLNGANR